jgi:hypothetical protein
MIEALRDEDYYPSIDPPTFNQRGGEVALPFSLVLTNPNGSGSIRYTLDGSDPVEGGSATYSSPVPITESIQVRTRVLRSGEWSAIDEVTFIVPEAPALRITEIMYHPSPPTAAEIAAGFTDQDDFEFIELHNRGSLAVELEGVRFTDGVSFFFPAHTLAAGARVLIVSNPAAFAMRYGGDATVIGSYGPTRLANGGERLRLESALGETITDLSYGDSAPWPVAADGGGESLVFIDSAADTDPALGENWRASALPGGSPGTADTLTFANWAAVRLAGRPPADLDALADPDFDDLVNLIEYAFDLDPLVSDAAGMPRAMLDGDLMSIEYQRDLYKTDLTILAEVSGAVGSGWTFAGVMDTLVSTALESELRRVTVDTGASTRQFVRLQISLP